ncbi:MAG: riboflavin synthase, partial [bacterium]|nr:riboflavin synthase [bacterium]
EEQGRVVSLSPRGEGATLTIACATVLEDSKPGSSISVNGVCLTAAELQPDSFSADVAPETLRRSNLGGLRAGAMVNLERPLSPSGRLGGHIVQGHVDATGEFLSLEELGDGDWWLIVRFPEEIAPYTVFKGSIAIDGISLTIAALEDDTLSVTVVPHTYRNTTLSGYSPGARLNLECDIIAKYVANLVGKLDRPTGLSVDKLKEMGY